jgi:transcriptional regulator with XRE-family HTH domain
MGITRSRISDRLNGVKAFEINEVRALARALNTSVAYLIGETDERSPRRSAPGGGSFFLPFESKYAIRDSNPEPADLLLERPRPALRLIRGGGATLPVAVRRGHLRLVGRAS